ncbi:Crp/Fnr family transcriptional regulator [Ramlibacter sp. HM2]|uniref:Crp/Fnr family transcriptional regulator n=1 Tax=Ramlibacter pallidus TaxID=2780087 RepID=A0ABR9S0P6_9BURK|nr:Crp/Fnr family transcriptional regulator [Ramlibacter pallidus]
MGGGLSPHDRGDNSVGWRTDAKSRGGHPAGLDRSHNQLIAGLGARAGKRLVAAGESTPLGLAAVLAEAGAPVRHVYFPMQGFISLVAVASEGPAVEVGMIGAEGMFGASLALGVPTHPVRAIVQGSGHAWRIPAPAFRREMACNPGLHRAVCRYLYVLLVQQARSAVCLRFHPIAQRLARWLLMTGDRAGSARFHLTQEFLAYMIGVRREGITLAAGALQRQGLIAYRRGEVHILDRAGLEAAACSCYAADRATHADVLG